MVKGISYNAVLSTFDDLVARKKISYGPRTTVQYDHDGFAVSSFQGKRITVLIQTSSSST